MKKDSLKLPVCLILLCLTLSFIWGNSAMPATDSAQLSGGVMELLQPVLHFFGLEEIVGMHLLRKAAHFTEYLLLGMEFCWLFQLLHETGIHRFAMPLLCGSLAACADETIQIFAEGRGSSLLDVWIDIGGLTVGIVLLLLGYAILTKGRTNTQTNFGG